MRPPRPDDLAALNTMLVTLVESRGSDLHLTVGLAADDPGQRRACARCPATAS